MWDLVVVGAGPAGTAAALSALRAEPRSRVLVLDRSDFPRDKACGDGVAAHALHVLSGLDVHDLTDGYPAVPGLTLGYRNGPQVQGLLDPPAYVIPRAVFDARLLDAAVAHGAVFRRHRVRSVHQRVHDVLIDGDIAARALVAADGANSVVRGQAGLRGPRKQHVALAIRGYAPYRDDAPHSQRISLGGGAWPAYAWSFPIGNGYANVGYGEIVRPGRQLTRDGLLRRLDDLLPGARDDARHWRAHHLPLSSGRPRQPDGRVLFAGDALSLINPLTGEGIYYAILSGSLAGRVAVRSGAAAAGHTYRSALRRELGRHLRHTTLAARLATMRPLVERLVRGAENPYVFADLAEIGLGRGLVTRRMLAALLTDGTTFPGGSARAGRRHD